MFHSPAPREMARKNYDTIMVQKRQRPTRTKDDDLRRFWPGYEQSWDLRGRYGAPPHALNQIGHARRERQVTRVLPTLVSLLIVAAVLWILFR